MSEEVFKPRLGKVGHRKSTKPKLFIRQVLDAAYRSGMRSHRKSSFTGQRIGRGAAMGTLAAAGFMRGGSRKAVVKVHIAKLKAGNLSAARAHMRYIQRDEVTLQGEPGQLYGRDTDEADGTAFVGRCEGDRHQFRIIVSADDGAELADLKPFIRDLMQRMEMDLETELEWVAVNHFNIGHPHTHIVIKGKAQDGKDLIIAKDYITHGIRAQASELLSLELGPEDEFAQRLKLIRQVQVDRFTPMDRSILKQLDESLLVVSSLPPADPMTHAATMRRLKHLQGLGLAEELQTGVWHIDPNMEPKLRALGQRNDIIRTMHRAMKEAEIDRPSGSFAIFHAEEAKTKVVGRIAALGLTDAITDRHYVVVDGTDGRVHYPDIGNQRPGTLPDKGMIVSLEASDQGSANRQQARLRIVSYLNLEKLTATEGPTWLDRELTSKAPTHVTHQGYGADVRAALRNRMQWLTERGLTQTLDDGSTRLSPNAIHDLKRKELHHAVNTITARSGLSRAKPVEGENFSGTYKHAVNLASGKYAIVENAKEFVLVPWKPSFEDIRGKAISSASGPTHAWERVTGRQRGLGI
jgi:type IV secretory pathway VirD2 relaxase